MKTHKGVWCALVVLVTLFGAEIARANLVNLAPGGTASQSSLWTLDPDGIIGYAYRANDGNNDGNWKNGSVSHTSWEVSPWWEVDLGTDYQLDDIVIYNRTDGCSERLTNFTVSVWNDSGTKVWSDDFYKNGGYPAVFKTIDLYDGTSLITGRRVRVQLNGDGVNITFLHLAEVQVWSVPEPSSLLLLMAGSGILLRKRKTTKR